MVKCWAKGIVSPGGSLPSIADFNHCDISEFKVFSRAGMVDGIERTVVFDSLAYRRVLSIFFRLPDLISAYAVGKWFQNLFRNGF